MKRLNNKTCVITGAGRGIGAAIATHFAAQGAQVIVTDKNLTTAQQVASDIGGIAHELDVTSEDQWDKLAAQYPEIDVLVNNAGITGFEGGIVAHDPENAQLPDWHRVHSVNLDGTFLGCRSYN